MKEVDGTLGFLTSIEFTHSLTILPPQRGGGKREEEEEEDEEGYEEETRRNRRKYTHHSLSPATYQLPSCIIFWWRGRGEEENVNS